MDMKNNKSKLQQLADLMNEQSETPFMITDDLLYTFDAVLEPEEVEFLLKIGGGNLRRSDIEDKAGLSKKDCGRLIETLLNKGHITELEAGDGQRYLHIMCILPGWFEHYLMSGADTPDRREFSRRVSAYYSAVQAIPPDVVNMILKDLAPNRSVATVNPSSSRMIEVNRALPPQVSEFYPTHSVLALLEKVPENETIAVFHCFCRQQRKLDGDPCRMHLPEEACIGLGPAAEHLTARNFGRRISKQEAIALIKEAEKRGAIHQVGRLVPLKDFKTKYENDIICNCCWDCCGVIGNYSRGNTPFMLKSYYIAEMLDDNTCNGCGVCEEYCPVRAIAVDGYGIARIDAKMCCGCGLCALHCPEQAVSLKPFERNVFLPVLEKNKRRIP